MFKWSVEQEMVPASILHALQAVAGLKRGRTNARETAPVKPMTDEHIEEVLPHLSEQVAATVSLQRLTSMRPGEVCAMGAATSTWPAVCGRIGRPRTRTSIAATSASSIIGPQAQELIQRFPKPRTEDYLFSPADAEGARRAKLHAERETPLSCGNVPGSNRRRRPRNLAR